MKKDDSHFLDKQTLIALALVFLSWFLWERYMRSKYGTEKPLPKEEIHFVETPSEEVLKEQKQAPRKKRAEKVFIFENKEWKVVFSSKGLGIKNVELKNHFDRKKTPIAFQSSSEGYLFEIKKEEQPIYFNQIQKKSKNSFMARAENLPVTVEFFFQDYFINYKIKIQKDLVSSLEVITSHKAQKGAQGFIEGMLGREQGASLFTKNLKEKKQRLFFNEEGQQETFSQTSVFGLGTRYFGQGWVNLSDISPLLYVQQNLSSWNTTLSFVFPKIGEAPSLKYKVFFGPKSIQTLSEVDSRLSSWVDFGFLSGLAKPILSFLKTSFLFTKNWGVSIILLTLLIRLILFPLNLAAYRSMNAMKKIQPKIKAIREKYKNKADPKKMNEETLQLMKSHKANPFGGCLPMFLQLPVFFALYRVLGESFELYQSPFIFWIQDLSVKDPFYILPVLMGVTMYLQQKITPTNMDPRQEKIFRLLPLIFSFFMISLPSGLILYIFVSTLFGLAQQYFFTRQEKNS